MTYSSEKLRLRWNDFKQNIINSYQELQIGSDFSDVTLVCEEDRQFEAHRIILSVCSLFFNRVLKGNKHTHPMIYMRGLNAKNLEAILDFIYRGEVNINQEDLDEFLALAEELQLKGLEKDEEHTSNADEENMVTQKTLKHKYYQSKANSIVSQTNQGLDCQYLTQVNKKQLVVSADTSIEDLKVKIYSMMESIEDGPNKWKCVVCGKESTQKSNMKSHIETHMEGLSYSCNQCDKVNKSYITLAKHVSRHHRN